MGATDASWGNGFMNEACGAAIAWVTSNCGAGSIEAYIETDNLGSVKLARSLGFEPDRGARDGAARYLLGNISPTPL